MFSDGYGTELAEIVSDGHSLGKLSYHFHQTGIAGKLRLGYMFYTVHDMNGKELFRIRRENISNMNVNAGSPDNLNYLIQMPKSLTEFQNLTTDESQLKTVGNVIYQKDRIFITVPKEFGASEWRFRILLLQLTIFVESTAAGPATENSVEPTAVVDHELL